MESFYANHQGAVLSSTINKFVYISSHHYFDEASIRLKYSKNETVKSIAEIQHPLFREVLSQFGVKGSLEMSSNGDVPAGTGLGSSSAFTVGLLHNLYVREGIYATKKRLAEEACAIEIDRLKEPIGKQDHYAAAFGGLNVIRFNTNGKVDVEPIHLDQGIHRELEGNLLMFYTGTQRSASTILQEQKDNIAAMKKSDVLIKMVDLVWELRDSLFSGDISSFGEILDRNWALKQQLANGIGTDQITSMYRRGIAAGALGGKLLGAGGGGFLLFYCEREKQERLRMELAQHQELKFRFEDEGSKLVFVGDEYED
jgi:D-glycero-alpha-D-manno-heptose-7-phosphate kinase